MTGRPRSERGRRGALPDMALVGLVVGGGATFVLGALALGVGALTGRVSLVVWLLFVLWVLLALGTLVCAVALAITHVRSRSHRSAADRSGTDDKG